VLVAGTDERPHWLLVRTKRLQERKAAQALEARRIEAYCPMVLEPRLSRFAPRGPVPLFPGYVFGRVALRETFAAAQYCPGSVGLVRLGDGFAALEEKLVAELKEREGARGYAVLDLVPRQLRNGVRVRVTRGALRGWEGIVSRYVPARQRVRMLLGVAYGVRAVEVDAADVRCG
jgi:transcription termination factor NusG